MPPRSIAQAFADHLNSLLNRTVTDARMAVIADPSHPARFTLACLRGTTPISFALPGWGCSFDEKKNVDLHERSRPTLVLL